MKPTLVVEVDPEPLERVGADAGAVLLCENERPLRGGVGRADWRLGGWISELVRRGKLRGARGEIVLVPTRDRLRAPRLLVVGVGPRERLGPRTLVEASRAAAAAALRLGATSLVLPAPPLASSAQRRDERWARPILEGLVAGLAGSVRGFALRLGSEPGAENALARKVEEAARELAAARIVVHALGHGRAVAGGAASGRMGSAPPGAAPTVKSRPGPPIFTR